MHAETAHVAVGGLECKGVSPLWEWGSLVYGVPCSERNGVGDIGLALHLQAFAVVALTQATVWP